MKRWTTGCLLLLVFPFCAWSQQVVRTMPVVLQLDVNAQGAVTRVVPMQAPVMHAPAGSAGIVVHTMPPPLPESLVKAATQVASSWHFKTRQVDGKPVSGRTWARAKLQIIKKGKDAYAVDLSYQGNGPYLYRTVATSYPPDMRRRGISAGLVVEYVVEPDGSLGDIKVTHVLGDVTSGRSFRQAALASLGRSKAHPELIDGKPVATRVRTSVMFELKGTGSPAQRAELRQQVAQAMHPRDPGAPWKPVMQGYGMLALDSPFEKTDAD